MHETEQKGYLRANTLIFAQNVIQSLADMVGAEFSLRKDTLRETPFTTTYSMIISIHFSGSIQGDYLVCLDDAVALKLIGAFDPAMTPTGIRELRETYGGFLKELLNLSVGLSIVELEKSFGDLTFAPATVIYGEIETAKIPSGNIEIEGIAGKIQCGFLVNLANVKIGQKLEDALVDLEKKALEVRESQRNIAHILQALPIGLCSIDATGTVLPGQSKATAAVVGLPAEENITGQALDAVVGVSGALATEWKTWLSLVFERYGQIPFGDMKELCVLNEVRNGRDRVLKLNWLPIVNENESALAKLLVVIDDITRQRELEKSAEQLAKQHQENIELISQVINLQPDEVTNFVYDSSQLLGDAQAIVQSNNRDREFINELFRTFHTLKGSSGQYRFNALQDFAHKVEDYLKSFRDNPNQIDEKTIKKIMTSIEEARGYISRIQDVRVKLGGKDETIAEKSERNARSVMIELGRIEEINASVKRLMEKGALQKIDRYYLQEIADIERSVRSLRQIRLSFFHSSLESLAANVGEKTGKKVSLAIRDDVLVDIEPMRQLHQCLIHLINNAIDHGIEPPDERAGMGKLEQGIIVLSGTMTQGNRLVLTIQDDGRGINKEEVKQKAIALYALDPASVEAMKDQELYAFLFKAGFTTKKEATEISGRGVGLDVVHHIIEGLGGTVGIESNRGKGTLITLSVPVPE
jgi:two-component system, chemotaxis family, sensor kinase CheA